MKVLENQIAIVTGAGNPRGMGRAIAEALAEAGAHVCASDVGESTPDPLMEALGYAYGAATGLDETVAAIQARGVEAVGVHCDVTDEEEVAALVEKARQSLGPPTLLVNVAGGSWGSNLVADYVPDQWLKTLQVNLFGVFLTCRAVLPHMVAEGKGAIVNIASIAAVRSHQMVSAYGAAKAGVLQFTRDLAVEYGPMGVRANALLPGDIKTDMYAMEAKGMAMMLGMNEEEVMALSAESTPLKRLGSPEDVAALTVFLCSDQASFLTGLAIPVTGGKELAFRGH